MKTIKFFLVSLFMMLGLAAQAQQVVINKTDGTVEVFQTNECDSIVYDVKDFGYYREDDNRENDVTAPGWVKLTSSPQEIDWLKVKNIAIATPTNVKPTLEVHSKASGNWVLWKVFNASVYGKPDTITINSKTYYLWLNISLTSATDDDKIRITL